MINYQYIICIIIVWITILIIIKKLNYNQRLKMKSPLRLFQLHLIILNKLVLILQTRLIMTVKGIFRRTLYKSIKGSAFVTQSTTWKIFLKLWKNSSRKINQSQMNVVCRILIKHKLILLEYLIISLYVW